MSYRQVASALGVSATTVVKIAKDYALNGLDYAVSYHYNQASRPKQKVNEELEACVVQLACGKVPEGYADWTLELLTREANKKGVAEPVCKETIRVMLYCTPGTFTVLWNIIHTQYIQWSLTANFIDVQYKKPRRLSSLAIIN